MAILTGLQPSGVFEMFEQLCGIPHGSRNTKAISDFCVRFAQEHGLDYRQDDSNNVILFAPATPGMEQAQPVMLQGHLDMVCEKEADCPLDLQKEGLHLRTEGEWIWAEGTTLGGDDGIAVAYALAILADPAIPHPPLEVVLTTDEEIGMLGAAAIDLSEVKARRVLNIDSEEEGVLLAGCAGGATVCCHIPLMWTLKKGLRATVQITGLRGGHSGMEIQKGRANANKLMGRFLNEMDEAFAYALCTVNGGNKDNAIARESTADVVILPERLAELTAFAAQRQEAYRAEYGEADPDITVAVTPGTEDTFEIMMGDCRRSVLSVLQQLPNGVQQMSRDIEGLVQTSLNLGILKVDFRGIHLTSSVRSSVNAEKQQLIQQLAEICGKLGGSCEVMGEYPAWEYKADSPLREIMTEVYMEQYGRKPTVEVIHAGLECGLLSGKLDGLDCVSFGPDILDIHTTREKLSIPSVQRTWKLLLEVLKRCN
ncbi:aminoacyl-histidine dipeptidase [Butyricicoccus sp.]|uniref:aminoacyl-histidine dipeptidase n=1 Tax=Butyricicoccus sp. TaxID=2049021 RepID=UPI003F176AF4